MSTSTMSSFQLRPSLLLSVKLHRSKGLQSLAKKPSSLLRTPSGAPNWAMSAQSTGKLQLWLSSISGSAAGLNLPYGLEVSTARKTKEKVIHHVVDDYGADVVDKSTTHVAEKRTRRSHDTGGTTGLLVWAASVGSVLIVGALVILMSGVCYMATPDYTLPLL